MSSTKKYILKLVIYFDTKSAHPFKKNSQPQLDGEEQRSVRSFEIYNTQTHQQALSLLNYKLI